jgi:uncharacterized protein with beta-barrel porin domain
MKLKFAVAFSILAYGAWTAPSYAQRQQATGAGVTPIDADGILNGVDITGAADTGTLTVGTVGGPATDIDTSNAALASGVIAVGTATTSSGNVVFNSSSTVYGNIGVTQPAGPYLLNISAGNDGTTVNFLGSVYATTIDDIGTGTLNFDSGSTNDGATNFAADGVISLAANTTLIGALTTSAADTGTLNLASGSVLDGAVGGGSGLKSINLTGNATVEGAVDSYAFNLGTSTLDVDGALTIASSTSAGVINTTIASTTVYGNISVLGATNLGATTAVHVTVPTTTFIPVGTQFNIVSSRTGTAQSGTNGSLVVPTVTDVTNPLYTFVAVPAAGTVAGKIVIEVTGIPINTVTTAVVPVLLAAATTSPAVTTALAAIDSLTSTTDVARATAELQPTTADLAAALLSLQVSREFQDAWLARMSTVCSDVGRRPDAPQSCPTYADHGGWWAKGLAYFGNQNAKNSFGAYNSRILGTVLGIDRPVSPNTRVGLSFGFANTAIDERDTNNHNDSNTYEGTAYIGHNIGAWFVNGDISFAWNNYNSTRQLTLENLQAKAGYGGQTYTAFGITGYNFYTHGATLTPLASLQYSDIAIDGYRETGAGALGLHVNSHNYSFLETGLGGKIAGQFVWRGANLVPEAHAKWLYDLDNPGLRDTANFELTNAQSFTTTDMKTAASTYNVGGGLTLLSCSCTAQNWSINAVYDFYVRSDGYTANQGMLKYSRSF